MFNHVTVWGFTLLILKFMKILLTNIKNIDLITKVNRIIVTILLILSGTVFYGKRVSIFSFIQGKIGHYEVFLIVERWSWSWSKN